jgi:hypothetical protein
LVCSYSERLREKGIVLGDLEKVPIHVVGVIPILQSMTDNPYAARAARELSGLQTLAHQPNTSKARRKDGRGLVPLSKKAGHSIVKKIAGAAGVLS